MPAKKGVRPPNAGKGRTKGVPNRVTAQLKDMILGALNDCGGQQYLREQAASNPTAFLTLVGKVLPLTHAGDPDNPVKHSVEWTIVDPPSQRPAKA